MSDPVYDEPYGTSNYLLQVAAQDIEVFAYLSVPLVPLIELVFDSVAAPIDNVNLSPQPLVADAVQTSDSFTNNYPPPFTTAVTPTDAVTAQLTVKIGDNLTVSDNFAHTP